MQSFLGGNKEIVYTVPNCGTGERTFLATNLTTSHVTLLTPQDALFSYSELANFNMNSAGRAT
jgi:hypothetical protein